MGSTEHLRPFREGIVSHLLGFDEGRGGRGVRDNQSEHRHRELQGVVMKDHRTKSQRS